MESLGMRCGKSISFIGVEQKSSWRRRSSSSLHQHRQSKIKPMQTTRSSSSSAIVSPNGFNLKEDSSSWGKQNKLTTHEKLDEWMRDSVTEIVRNIGEAPFLVHLYSPATNRKNKKLELERETAMADSWPSIKRGWSEGCPIPDGVILVEQLDKEKGLQVILEEDDKDEDPTTTAMATATGTKAWGVLVQGKGVETAACYILKTCRVWSSLGFCTHFCLVKAKCFGESAELQLQNSWNGNFN
ncbi:hypothetical protein ACHQM5_025904 [Ranunculus cassubicifolius]